MAVELIKIPNSMFNSVVKQVELVSVQLLNSKDREEIKKRDSKYDGLKDVLITNGERKGALISRDELLTNFRNTNGKKIRIAGWHYHKLYTVYSSKNEERKLLKIPKKTRFDININGRTIPRPSLVVCKCENGEIDKKHPLIISSPSEIKLFRKMYRVTELASMKKAKNEAHERRMIEDIQVKREEIQNKKVWGLSKPEPEDELKSAPYTVVGRALSKQAKLIGFLVKNIKTGETTMINLNNAKKYCADKKLNNVTVATMQETGKVYFRGIGIKIDNLPSKQYNI